MVTGAYLGVFSENFPKCCQACCIIMEYHLLLWLPWDSIREVREKKKEGGRWGKQEACKVSEGPSEVTGGKKKERSKSEKTILMQVRREAEWE